MMGMVALMHITLFTLYVCILCVGGSTTHTVCSNYFINIDYTYMYNCEYIRAAKNIMRRSHDVSIEEVNASESILPSI